MARGWESKSVESQQADRDMRSQAADDVPAAERERRARRRTLELALSRARADLAVAAAPGYRAMLERAIATLEAEIGGTPPAGDTRAGGA